jgi:Ca2+-binding RTX toxin-like protein
MAVPAGTTFEATFNGGATGESYTGAQLTQLYSVGPDWDDYNIRGNGGNDILKGAHGDDNVEGGAGNDTISGGHGRNSIDGGDGYDTADYSQWGVGVVGKGTGGINVSFKTNSVLSRDGQKVTLNDLFENFERIIGTNYDDIMYGNDLGISMRGGTGNDQLNSGSGVDYIAGETGNDTLNGGLGNDFLWGGDGNDRITCGTGNDAASGGLGADRIIGGAGVDTYYYSAAGESGVTGATRDFIDFKTDEDILHLRGIDANTLLAGNQNFIFIGKANFSGVEGQLRFFNATSANGTYTIVEADRNSNGVADFAIGIDGTRSLDGLDFVL